MITPAVLIDIVFGALGVAGCVTLLVVWFGCGTTANVDPARVGTAWTALWARERDGDVRRSRLEEADAAEELALRRLLGDSHRRRRR